MKVLCFGYFCGAGGAERQLIKLANNLCLSENTVKIVALGNADIRYTINPKVKIIKNSGNTFHGLFRIIYNFLFFIKTILIEKPDLSIHYWLQTVYFASILPRFIKGKVIYSERGDPGDKEYYGIKGILRTWAFLFVDGFVFQSKGAQRYFNKSIIKKSVIIPNSVFIPEQFVLLPLVREKKIVNVGRLHPQKNQKLLIDAFQRINKEFPDYTLEIYGDGYLKDNLNTYIKELGLESKVFIIDSCKNIFERIKKSSLFVLSSDYEGMPNSLMEAMGLGIPCLSTDCKPGGAREVIKNGYNGIIIPINEPQIMADSIKSMLINVNNSELIARRAQNILYTNSDSVIFSNWKRFINKITNNFWS